MIYSMTGYAAATRDLPTASLAAEVKSVNGRFLDVQFRLPEELRAAEPALREMIQARVGRGKVECRVSVTPPTGAAPRISVNEALLAELAETSRKIRAAVPDALPLSVDEVLRWPGVLGDDRSAALREACVALVQEVLEEFAATRSREGAKLAAMLIERAERMKSLLASIQPRLPEAIAAYEEKLAARLREVLGGTDEERIRQEIALYGVKADVAEELNRLGAHLVEVQRVVSAGGPVGKRLDFLMQELNREANTLGSKS
ncbi:MAG: YicC family protein, partial [Betaproteobacteria bacterium]